MDINKFEMTKEGEAELRAEYRNLLDVVRPEVIEQIAAARAQGDLKENADYDAARNRQGEIEDRIKYLENVFANLVIISHKAKTTKTVTMGTKITVKEEDGSEATYLMVGTVEADPFIGKVSIESPLGIAVRGKKVGDIVTVKATVEYKIEIVKIESGVGKK